ncbi:MAG: type VI secretion system protein ImpK [Phenylobacterium sp.]|jgi:type VI secretion system protein ImpK
MNDKTVIRPGGRRPRKPTDAEQPQHQPQGQMPTPPAPAPQQPQGYPPQQSHAPQQPQGYPPQQPHAPQQPQGYPPQQQPPPGFAQQSPPGYAQQPPPGYAQQPPPGNAQQPPPGQQLPPGYAQPGIHGVGTSVIDMVIPLLSIVSSVKSASTGLNLEEFKTYTVEQIRYFHSVNFGLGANGLAVDRELVDFASYGLCALVDELILNTPWGAESSWTSESLLVLFHRQAWGGEQFFSNLDEMIKQPANNLAVLSLYYACLELGFLGKYRELPNGSNTLNEIKNHLFNVIRQHQPHIDTTLSPAWRGVSDDRGGIVKYVPFWVVSLVTLGLGLAAFAGFYWSIGDKAGWVDKEVAKFHAIESLNVVPGNMSSLGRSNVAYQPSEPIDEPDLVKEVVEYDQLLRDLLADDISRGRVVIEDQSSQIFVKLVGSNMFSSGSHRLSDEFIAIVEKVGQFLAEHDIAVNVMGHTDSVPISSIRYANNYALSQARADTVLKILEQDAFDSSKIKATGLADSQNIAGNDTAQGRAKNRRVEIVLVK